MRFIPISHIKQKIFQKLLCQNQLVDCMFRSSSQGCLPPAQALAHWGREGSGAAATTPGIEDDQARPHHLASWAQS